MNALMADFKEILKNAIEQNSINNICNGFAIKLDLLIKNIRKTTITNKTFFKFILLMPLFTFHYMLIKNMFTDGSHVTL